MATRILLDSQGEVLVVPASLGLIGSHWLRTWFATERLRFDNRKRQGLTARFGIHRQEFPEILSLRDLHAEVMKNWGVPHTARIHVSGHPVDYTCVLQPGTIVDFHL